MTASLRRRQRRRSGLLRRALTRAPSYPSATRARRQLGPCHGHVGSHRVGTDRLAVGHELAEQLLGPSQLEANSPPDCEVIVNGDAQGAHSAPPGHGRASSARASWSTLA